MLSPGFSLKLDEAAALPLGAAPPPAKRARAGLEAEQAASGAPPAPGGKCAATFCAMHALLALPRMALRCAPLHGSWKRQEPGRGQAAQAAHGWAMWPCLQVSWAWRASPAWSAPARPSSSCTARPSTPSPQSRSHLLPRPRPVLQLLQRRWRAAKAAGSGSGARSELPAAQRAALPLLPQWLRSRRKRMHLPWRQGARVAAAPHRGTCVAAVLCWPCRLCLLRRSLGLPGLLWTPASAASGHVTRCLCHSATMQPSRSQPAGWVHGRCRRCLEAGSPGILPPTLREEGSGQAATEETFVSFALPPSGAFLAPAPCVHRAAPCWPSVSDATKKPAGVLTLPSHLGRSTCPACLASPTLLSTPLPPRPSWLQGAVARRAAAGPTRPSCCPPAAASCSRRC